MKPEVMLELLENAAEQLNVKISYEALQMSIVGNGLRGGICKVKGPTGMQWRLIVDKRATNEEKLTTIATSLATFDTSELELSQKVREVLRTHEGSSKLRRTAGSRAA